MHCQTYIKPHKLIKTDAVYMYVSMNNTAWNTAGKTLRVQWKSVLSPERQSKDGKWRWEQKEGHITSDTGSRKTGRRTYTSWCLRQTPLSLTNCQSHVIVLEWAYCYQLYVYLCLWVEICNKRQKKREGEKARSNKLRSTGNMERENRERKKQKQMEETDVFSCQTEDMMLAC